MYLIDGANETHHISLKNLLVSLNLQKNNLNIFYQKKRTKHLSRKM